MWNDAYFGEYWENQFYITAGVDPAEILSIYLFNVYYPQSNPTVSELPDIDGQTTVVEAFTAGAALDNDVFTDYVNGVRNRDCWTSWWDLSGVGWSNNRTNAYGQTRRCVLIGRDCAIGANHWSVGVGNSVVFTNELGQKFEYKIVSSTRMGTTDIQVYTLDKEVDESITSYAIETELEIGDWLISTRSRPATPDTTSYKTVIEQVSGISSGNLGTANVTAPANVAARYYQGGVYDSSDPFFLPGASRQPTLVACRFGITASPYYGETNNLALIDAELSAQGSTRQAQAGVVSSPVVSSTLTVGGEAASSPTVV